MPVDPFTQAHNAIWSALLAWEPWTSIVKPGNRIDVEQSSANTRRATRRTPEDFTTCEINQGVFTSRKSTSTAVTFRQNYTIYIVNHTTDKTIIDLNQCKYETLRALYNAGDSLGLPELIDNWDTTDARDQNKNGFNSILTIAVEMKIPITNLMNP